MQSRKPRYIPVNDRAKISDLTGPDEAQFPALLKLNFQINYACNPLVTV